MEDFDYLFKIILLGDTHVGKTSIVRRFKEGVFQDSCKTTLGVDFAIQTLNIDDTRVKLQIWDTSGQERFRAMTKSYFRNAHGALVVYDITDRKSLEEAEHWMDALEINATNNDRILCLLVGNKADLKDRREVTYEEAKIFARNHGMIGPVETSAKDGINIDQSFYSLARQCLAGQGSALRISCQHDDSILLHRIPPADTRWGCCGY